MEKVCCRRFPTLPRTVQLAVRPHSQNPNQHTNTTLNMDKANLRLSGKVSVPPPRARVRVSVLRNCENLPHFSSLIFQRGKSAASNRARRDAATRRERAETLGNSRCMMTDAESRPPSPQLTARSQRQRHHRQPILQAHRHCRLRQRWRRDPHRQPRFLPR